MINPAFSLTSPTNKTVLAHDVFGDLRSRIAAGNYDDLTPEKLNFRDNEGWTLLMRATVEGDEKLVRSLLHAGANPYMLNNNHEDGLSLAMQGPYSHRAGAILALLDFIPNGRLSRVDMHRETILTLALGGRKFMKNSLKESCVPRQTLEAIGGSMDVLKEVVRKDADIHELLVNSLGYTILDIVIIRYDPLIVRALLKSHTMHFATRVSDSSHTILHSAVGVGTPSLEIVEDLIKVEGIEIIINFVNPQGLTPLGLFLERGRLFIERSIALNILRVLLCNKADIHYRYGSATTASIVQWATSNSDPEIVKMLLYGPWAKGALNRRDHKGRTFLNLALKHPLHAKEAALVVIAAAPDFQSYDDLVAASFRAGIKPKFAQFIGNSGSMYIERRYQNVLEKSRLNDVIDLRNLLIIRGIGRLFKLGEASMNVLKYAERESLENLMLAVAMRAVASKVNAANGRIVGLPLQSARTTPANVFVLPTPPTDESEPRSHQESSTISLSLMFAGQNALQINKFMRGILGIELFSVSMALYIAQTATVIEMIHHRRLTQTISIMGALGALRLANTSHACEAYAIASSANQFLSLATYMRSYGYAFPLSIVGGASSYAECVDPNPITLRPKLVLLSVSGLLGGSSKISLQTIVLSINLIRGANIVAAAQNYDSSNPLIELALKPFEVLFTGLTLKHAGLSTSLISVAMAGEALLSLKNLVVPAQPTSLYQVFWIKPVSAGLALMKCISASHIEYTDRLSAAGKIGACIAFADLITDVALEVLDIRKQTSGRMGTTSDLKALKRNSL